MSTATLDIPAEVLAALAPELPTLDALTEDQAAGRACVWDAERLTLESAVDLGEREGIDGRWFPRGCRKCTGHRAHHALLDHGSQCPLCASEATAADCTVVRGLYRLQRECRR
jgi:predicted Zn-ribbon and HTH transcriptional regulator